MRRTAGLRRTGSRTSLAEDATDSLRAAVASALRTEEAQIVEARREPVDYDAFMAGRTLTRISGVARVGGEDRSWCLIEKVTEGPESAPAFIRERGRRELLAYRSHLLDDLPAGFAAPVAHGLYEDAGGRLLLYLEEVADDRPGAWTRSDWLRAATDLGRFSARGLASPVASAPWMLLGWKERHGQPHDIDRATVAMAEQARHPAVIAALGPGIGEPAGAMLAGQASLRDALDRLPQTLCHHDALRANLFMRATEGGPQTVAIDWETLGPGPVGAEIASLLFSSVRRGDLATPELVNLVPEVLRAYSGEIAAAGFAEAAASAEDGFWHSIALRWSLLRDVMATLATPGARMVRGRALEEPPEHALDDLVQLIRVLLEAWSRVERAAARSRLAYGG